MDKIRTYQSHDESVDPMSDSFHKLKRLNLPSDMTGNSFLDIGCNEGFFCAEARRRGASTVIGIDSDPNAIEFAKSKYSDGSIIFLNQSWDNLPYEKFDFILWASAMHYERYPRNVLSEIYKRLNRYGILILECGVSEGDRKEMYVQQRTEDTLWYPTMRMLFNEILKDFSVRQVSDGHIPVGDSIDRFVFHCQRKMPTVLLLTGGYQAGKTSLSRLLDPVSSQYVGVDNLIARLSIGKFHHDDFSKFLRDFYNPNDLAALYLEIDNRGFTLDFVNYVIHNIYWDGDLFILDAAFTENQINKIKDVLFGKAVVWAANRIS
jgi:ubiquinone/menaquinone biosynthesis C-methylase UbiE